MKYVSERREIHEKSDKEDEKEMFVAAQMLLSDSDEIHPQK